MKTEPSRRSLLLMMLGLAIALPAADAHADDDGGEGGGGSGGGSGSSGGSSGSGSRDPHKETEGAESEDKGESEDSDGNESEDRDEDNGNEIGETGSQEAAEAQNAVVEGQAKPLNDLISFLQENYPGQILDVDLKQESGKFEYRLKILQDTGKVIKLRLDAMTLALR